jgi:hypothetical protein
LSLKYLPYSNTLTQRNLDLFRYSCIKLLSFLYVSRLGTNQQQEDGTK